MNEQEEDFASLLRRARQGDAAALGELTRRYEAKIRLVARTLLGPALRPHLDSLDLVQSVHRSVMAGLRDERFDLAGADDLIGLAVTIVRRKVARQWRRRRREVAASPAAPADADRFLELLASLRRPQADPAREAQFREQLEHLSASLTPQERQMLQMRLDGHSSAEIAQALGLTHVNLRVRLTRLRQRLQSTGVINDWL
jgi:RNA polymerase sigma factor (sigma-70 family)